MTKQSEMGAQSSCANNKSHHFQHNLSMDWYKPPTIETHREVHTPLIHPLFDDEWRWPFWKVGYNDPDVLFGALHEEYNTLKCAIQDPYAWHHDVCDVANTARNQEEFLTLLKQRQKERFEEIQGVWRETKALLTARPSRLAVVPERSILWGYFIRLARNFSYDSLVSYFSSYIADDVPREPPLLTSGETSTSRPEQPGTTNDNTKGKKAERESSIEAGRTTVRPSGVSKARRKQDRREGVRKSARLQRALDHAKQ